MENSNGQDLVRQLMELLLPAMRERVATMGVEASGAFEFYRVATERGRVFNNYEIGVVELIKSRFPALTEIHEVGCGWGQLVFLLAWSGYVTTGFEIDERRYAGAAHFHRVLRDLDEPRASRARILNEFFPPLTRPNPIGTLALSTNIVIGNPRFVEEQILWGLTRYQYSVVNIDRFCYERPASERRTFIARVEAMGLTNRGLFHDAGAQGQFFLFERRDHGRSRS